jgi:hypothetical protein
MIVVDEQEPAPRQGDVLRSGTGGTATTSKTKFTKDPVTSVTLDTGRRGD